MSEFRPGEIVDITIKGARVHRAGIEGHDDDTTQVVQVVITHPDGGTYFATLPTQWAPVTVERVAPAEWPPRIGDVWRDKDGDPWFAISADKLVSPSASRYGAMLDTVVSEFGPLTLVHREDEQDGDTCKCGFRAPELGPHPGCPTHTQDGGTR